LGVGGFQSIDPGSPVPPPGTNVFANEGITIAGSNFGTALVAGEFATTFETLVTEIDFVFGGTGASTDQNVVFAIYDDAGGHPGSQIGAQTWSEVGDEGIVQSQTVSGLTLAAGQTFWLVALPGDANTGTLWNQMVPVSGGVVLVQSPPNP
jgi:hypothetical protein